MLGDLVAVGDLYVDLVVALGGAEPPVDFARLTSSSNSVAPIETAPGGTALQIAAAASAAGFRGGKAVGILGGDGGGDLDPDGAFLQRRARELGVDLLVATDARRSTGRVIILWSADGARLMISDRGANLGLDEAEVTPEMVRAVREASALHLSGYALLQRGRRAALRAMATEARAAGTIVALDYAPHDLHRFLTREQAVDAMVDVVDCAFVELPLAHRLATGRRFDPDDVDPAGIVGWWGERFRDVVIHVSPARALVAVSGAVRDMRFAHVPGPQSRGQSARVQVEILAGLCAREPVGATR